MTRSDAPNPPEPDEPQRFIYAASHDLNEPLRKIQAFGGRLADRYREMLPEEGQDYLDRMQSATARMQSLLAGLLELSRVSTRAREPVWCDLNEMIERVAQGLARNIKEGDASLEFADLPAIHGQQEHLFHCLIDNALKFARADVTPCIRIGASLQQGALEITIADNGIAFPADQAERIFGPFARLHARHEYAGAGMGLAIARKIASVHAGTLVAEGRTGEGTRLTLWLPQPPQSDAKPTPD